MNQQLFNKLNIWKTKDVFYYSAKIKGCSHNTAKLICKHLQNNPSKYECIDDLNSIKSVRGNHVEAIKEHFWTIAKNVRRRQ